MRIIRTLLISGIWIALLPYLGVPLFYKNILFSLSGIFLLVLSYQLYREAKSRESNVFDNFSENKDFVDNGEDYIAEYKIEINNQSNG
jgi:hypothetical protein